MNQSAPLAEFLQSYLGGPLWPWLLVAAVLVLFLVALPFGGFATYVERKVAADLQDRVGPNRVGPYGVLQFIADAVKMLAKEDFIPPTGDKFLFNLAPFLVIVGSCTAFAFLPLAKNFMGVDLNVGLLMLLAVTTLITPGILLGAWSSHNKWSLIGGMRATAQIVSYEIPVLLLMSPAILISGSLGIGQIVTLQGWTGQSGTVSVVGAHGWNIFHNPFAPIACLFLFIAGLAETNRLPFDLPEAESELVSGFNTEFSGMRFGLYALAEFAEVFVMCGLVTALYLGGWQPPFFNWENVFPETPELLIALLQLATFSAKTLSLVLVVMWLRWTLPRLRADQLMQFCWKIMVPVSLLCLLGTALWMWSFHGASFPQVVVGLFLGGGPQ